MRAAEESNTSEVDDSQVKTLEGAKPCLFMGMVAPGSQKYRVCRSVFPRVRASLGQSPTESARDCSERSVCTVKGCRVPSCTSGRRGRKHAHETARARFAVVPGHVWKMGSEKCAPDCSKKRKTSGVQRRVESFPLSRSVAIVDLRDTPAMRVCKWCVKTHWHGSESISGTATLIIVLLLYCAGL